jgi:heat-inducible transcriptional repressor
LRATLFAVVEEHIETAQPVASRSTARRSAIGFSPASVRSYMAELTELGFLSQPHVSAGRIPTDIAYRLYVDQLLHAQAGRALARGPIALEETAGSVTEFMQRATDLLSRVTGQVGFCLGRPAEEMVLERIHFTRLSSERILALLVSRGRVAQTRLIDEAECDARTLEHISARISETVAGLTLAEARSRLASTIEFERALSDELRKKLFVLGWEGLARTSEVELYVGDRGGLLAQPEFNDVEQLRHLMGALEEKERMMRLLDQVLRAETGVGIGEELHDPGVRACALVAAPLGAMPGAGGVGVIGPVRMRYDVVIPAVRYVSERVSQYLC